MNTLRETVASELDAWAHTRHAFRVALRRHEAAPADPVLEGWLDHARVSHREATATLTEALRAHGLTLGDLHAELRHPSRRVLQRHPPPQHP